MCNNKASVNEIVRPMSKIIEHKLNVSNYLEWSKTIRVCLRSVDKDNLLIQEPSSDETKQSWLRDVARMFLQIRNSIDYEVIGLINHCEFIEELMDYSCILAKGMCLVFMKFTRPSIMLRRRPNHSQHILWTSNRHEELDVYFPFNTDIKVQQSQREQMAVMSFLVDLQSRFETSKSHVLSSSDF